MTGKQGIWTSALVAVGVFGGLAPGGVLAANLTATVDCRQIAYPPLVLQRGYVTGWSSENVDGIMDEIENAARIRLGMATACLDLHRGNAKEPGQAASFLSDFSRDSEKIVSWTNADWIRLRDRADERRLLIVQQLSGVPMQGPNGKEIFTLDPNFFYHGHANYYPLPIPKEYGVVAEAVANFCRDALWSDGSSKDAPKGARRITPTPGRIGHPTIWCFNQEPEHTMGFRAGDGGAKGEVTEEGKAENLERYIRLYSQAGKEIRARYRDAMIGHCQENAAQGKSISAAPGAIDGGGYLRATNYFMQWEKTRGESYPWDFFTIQNYQGEDSAEILTNARFALSSSSDAAARGHQQVTARYQKTPILVNRYYYGKTESAQDNRNTAAGMVRMLECELTMLGQPDLYGYSMKTGGYETRTDWMTHKVGGFLCRMPCERRPLAFSGAGANGDLRGFAAGNSLGAYIALWNKGGKQAHDVVIQFENLMPAAVADWGRYTLEVLKGEGSTLGVAPGVKMRMSGADSCEIAGLSLGPQTFALIRLDADGAVPGKTPYSDALDRNSLTHFTFSREQMWCDRQPNSYAPPHGMGRYDHRTATLTVATDASAGVGLAGAVFRKAPTDGRVQLIFSLENLPRRADNPVALDVRIDYLDGAKTLKSVFIQPEGYAHGDMSLWNTVDWNQIVSAAKDTRTIGADGKIAVDIGSDAPTGWADAADSARGIMISLLLANAPGPAMAQVRLSDELTGK